MEKILLWFRRDLRLDDNVALHFALEQGTPVPVYIYSPSEESPWQPGCASRWWLHHSLVALDSDLRERGSRLTLRSGPVSDALLELCRETGARTVVCNRIYEPSWLERDKTLHSELQQQAVRFRSCPGSLLFEPWTIRSGSDNPYRVFTPFWRNCSGRGLPQETADAPAALPRPPQLASAALEEFSLLPRGGWDSEFYEYWQPGESGARNRLSEFVSDDLPRYARDRDRPALRATTGLSAHLHFGELAPRRVVASLLPAMATDSRPGAQASGEGLLRELGWREFAHHVLFHFPRTDHQPMDRRFRNFPWRRSSGKLFNAWCRGLTGFPIVDAGMRELWATGIMHNRVRMIAASFLTKNCRIHWRHGAHWFWDTLVDADLPNNSLNWQWVAGSGADAAPYFRIFNPVTQSEKFDPRGEYLRRWLPELASLPDRWLHRPWEAPPAILDGCGIRLGRHYPEPVLDLKLTREEALSAYRQHVQQA